MVYAKVQQQKGKVQTGFTEGLHESGVDRMKEQIKENYDRIKSEVKQIVEIEIQRIKDDPDLCHLLPKEE